MFLRLVDSIGVVRNLALCVSSPRLKVDKRLIFCHFVNFQILIDFLSMLAQFFIF